MKSVFTIIICSILLFFSGETFGQQTLSVLEAKEDIDFLYENLLQIHPGLYKYQEQLVYERLKDGIKRSLKDSIGYLDFFKGLSPMIYEIKDLHTNYGHSKAYLKEHNLKLPFILAEIEGRNILKYNTSSDTTFCSGIEILSIDGHQIEEIKRFLERNIGTDNGNLPAKELYASRLFFAYYPKFYDLGDSVRIETRTLGNDSKQVFNLTTVSSKQIGERLALRYSDNIRKNLSYEIVDSTYSLAKLDVSSFVFKGSPFDLFQMKFGRKLKRNFKTIRKDSIQNLILDLRGNGGGYIPNVNKLLKYLATEPYKMIDTMAFRRSAYFKVFPIYRGAVPLFAPLIFNERDSLYRFKANSKPPKKKPSRLAFDGNLFVFMDAASYSATAITICILKDMDRAIFIGEHPGGANWGSHAGNWYIAKLPNSKIRVRIPEFRIVHNRGRRSHNDFFVLPDLPVKYTLENFKNDEDAFLEVLKAYLLKSN
jgi:hypothetical protein